MSRDVFRTLSNILKWSFCKNSSRLLAVHYSRKNYHVTWILDKRVNEILKNEKWKSYKVDQDRGKIQNKNWHWLCNMNICMIKLFIIAVFSVLPINLCSVILRAIRSTDALQHKVDVCCYEWKVGVKSLTIVSLFRIYFF